MSSSKKCWKRLSWPSSPQRVGSRELYLQDRVQVLLLSRVASPTYSLGTCFAFLFYQYMIRTLLFLEVVIFPAVLAALMYSTILAAKTDGHKISHRSQGTSQYGTEVNTCQHFQFRSTQISNTDVSQRTSREWAAIPNNIVHSLIYSKSLVKNIGPWRSKALSIIHTQMCSQHR